MIITIVLISFFCQGLNILLEENMILGFIRVYLDRKLVGKETIKYWLKPIVYCHVCFASFWGSIVYVSITDQYIIQEWFICIVSASFLNSLLYNLRTKLE